MVKCPEMRSALKLHNPLLIVVAFFSCIWRRKYNSDYYNYCGCGHSVSIHTIHTEEYQFGCSFMITKPALSCGCKGFHYD